MHFCKKRPRSVKQKTETKHIPFDLLKINMEERNSGATPNISNQGGGAGYSTHCSITRRTHRGSPQGVRKFFKLGASGLSKSTIKIVLFVKRSL